MKTPPKHGERRCYMAGCRCDKCRAANAAYCKRYRLDRHTTGRPRRVDARPYIKLAERYAAHGWSHSQMADLAGCCETIFFALINGRSVHLNQKTARQLDAMPTTPPDAPGRTRSVNATGSIRRVRALIAIGHDLISIAKAIGITDTALGRIINNEHERITARNAHAITALYSKWAITPGTSIRSRNRAAALGWHGPMAWDADTIDDPNAEPETAAPYQPAVKHGRDSMRRAEIAHLLGCGESIASIARQMNANEKYISDLISQGLDTPSYEAAA